MALRLYKVIKIIAKESSSDADVSERKQEDKLILVSNQVFRVKRKLTPNRRQPFGLTPMQFKTGLQTSLSSRRIPATKNLILLFLVTSQN